MPDLPRRHTEPDTPAAPTVGWWACQHEHAFIYGDEDWHRDSTQGDTQDGRPIPCYCAADWPDCAYARRYGMVGDPCMDSSVLMGPFEAAADAVAAVRDYKQKGLWPNVGTPDFDPIDSGRSEGSDA